MEWEKALEDMIGALTEYLENGKFADVSNSAELLKNIRLAALYAVNEC